MSERILVIKHGALGDFIFAISGMRAIRELHPNAHLSLMTMGMFVDLAEQLGYFDDIIIDNRVSYWNIAANYRAVNSILEGKFDIIYDLQKSSRTRKRYAPLIRLFSRRPYIWYSGSYSAEGFCRTSRNTGQVETIPMPYRVTDLRQIHGKREHFGEIPDRYVVLIPGCSPAHPYKRWAVNNYATLARRLAESGIHSVVIGTKAEQAEIEQIAASTPMAVNFMGKNSLLDIPALAAGALACVGNDTGPTHMSSFCGTPVVSIFSYLTHASAMCLQDVPGAIPLVSPEKNINVITVDDVWQKIAPYLG